MSTGLGLTLGLGLGLTKGRAINPLLFYGLTFDPNTFELQGVRRGKGPLSNANTSTRFFFDHESIAREFGANEPGIVGAREVENLGFPSEGDITLGNWNDAGDLVSTAPGVDPPPGETGVVTRVTFENAASRVLTQVVDVSGRNYILSFWARSVSGTVSGLRSQVFDGSETTLPDLTTTWKRLSDASVSDGSSEGYIVRSNLAGTSEDIYIFGAQVEDSTGRIDAIVPGQYVKTTSSQVKTHFANKNGNTVLNNVVTEAVGAALSTPPFFHGGLAKTNLVVFSKDLTGAGWAGSATVTFDQDGLDGAVNNASLVDDSSVVVSDNSQISVIITDDSNPFLLRVTLNKDAITSRFPYLHLELAGGTSQILQIGLNTSTGATTVIGSTGTVDHEVNIRGGKLEVLIQVDNNGTGNTTAQFRNRPAYGTTIGVLDVTAIGSIVVQNVEFFANATIEQIRGTSFIFTTGAAASILVDDLSVPDTNHINENAVVSVIVRDIALAVDSSPVTLGTDGRVLTVGSSTAFSSQDGTTTAVGPTISLAGDDTEYHIAVAYGNLKYTVVTDGVAGVEQDYDGAFDNILSKLRLMGARDGSLPTTGQEQRELKITRANYANGDAVALAEAITTP